MRREQRDAQDGHRARPLRGVWGQAQGRRAGGGVFGWGCRRRGLLLTPEGASCFWELGATDGRAPPVHRCGPLPCRHPRCSRARLAPPNASQVDKVDTSASVASVDDHLNVVRPAINAMGGAVEVVSVEGGVVTLRYKVRRPGSRRALLSPPLAPALLANAHMYASQSGTARLGANPRALGRHPPPAYSTHPTGQPTHAAQTQTPGPAPAGQGPGCCGEGQVPGRR